MGLVFSAWDARLQRDVAIKILREEYASTEMRSRFLQEARAASGLNHPNICTIFDIGEQEGDPFLVMELLKGETLRTRINAGDIQLREMIRVGTEASDALSLAHARGIVHRDIKPANLILVDRPGGGFQTKVLDFGLAKVEAYGESIFDLTHTGTTVGTVAYMSPEQARGEALDARSDLFSLGVILYEMATGTVPFRGATSALVFVELLSNPPQPIRELVPNFPQDLEAIILKMLEKERADRYQNAEEVIEALTSVPYAGSAAARRPQADGPTPMLERPPLPLDAPLPVSSRQVPIAGSPEAATSSEPPAARSLRPIPRTSQSSSVHRVAAAPSESSTKVPLSADEQFLRPVKRIATDESSRWLTAAAPEARPAEPEAPKSEPESAPAKETPAKNWLVPEPAEPSYEGRDERFPSESRPIVPQSSRKPSHHSIPSISFPRGASAHPRPAPRFSRLEEVLPEEKNDPPSAPIVAVAAEDSGSKYVWMWGVAAVLVIVAGITAWKVLIAGKAATVNQRVIPIALVATNNSTGDAVLDGAVSAGVTFNLQQSPQFIVEEESKLLQGLLKSGISTFAAASLDDLRRGAREIQATELLIPEVRRNGNAYTLVLSVVSVENGSELLHVEETAQSREQIVDAIDRAVIDLRTASGEASDAVTQSSTPLAREGSSNLDALNAYTQGTMTAARGALTTAITSLDHATTSDPHFVRAWLQLAQIYRDQRSPAAAASAATAAQASSAQSSPRLQQAAAASVALNASGNLGAAISAAQQMLTAFPNGVRARTYMGAAQLEQGRFPEAFDTASAALTREPTNVEALRIAALAMIAQQRFEAAAPLINQAGNHGDALPEWKLLLQWLQNNMKLPDGSIQPANERIALSAMQAALEDASGNSRAAREMWQSLALEIGTHPQLFSAAGEVLAQEALEAALVEDCGVVPAIAGSAENYPLGASARFRVGLASALCGQLDRADKSLSELTSSFPQSSAVQDQYSPELKAVIQWKRGNAQAGLQTLLNTRQADMSSFTPYLRGLIHLRSGQSRDAVTDFELLLQHSGSTVLVLPMMYPLAQLGLARAYAASGDHGNSASAYAAFLTIYSQAAPNSALATEARNSAVQ